MSTCGVCKSKVSFSLVTKGSVFCALSFIPIFFGSMVRPEIRSVSFWLLTKLILRSLFGFLNKEEARKGTRRLSYEDWILTLEMLEISAMAIRGYSRFIFLTDFVCCLTSLLPGKLVEIILHGCWTSSTASDYPHLPRVFTSVTPLLVHGWSIWTVASLSDCMKLTCCYTLVQDFAFFCCDLAIFTCFYLAVALGIYLNITPFWTCIRDDNLRDSPLRSEDYYRCESNVTGIRGSVLWLIVSTIYLSSRGLSFVKRSPLTRHSSFNSPS